MSTLVIGGGVTGLAAATRALRAGSEVLLLEASGRLGGKIETERRDGYLVEWGPHSIVSTGTELFDWASELGLDDAIIPAQPEAERRYLWWRGKLVPTPRGPGDLLKTRLLSWGGKFRVLKELLTRSRTDGNESAAAFVARRFGPQVAERFLAPFVSGIYAGDASQLEVKSAFPRLPKWEDEYGSVIKGLLHHGRPSGEQEADQAERKPAEEPEPRSRGTYGFRDGMQTVVEAAATTLGDRARCHAPVRALRRKGERFEVDVTFGADHPASSETQTLTVDRVVVTTPAAVTADLLESMGEDYRDAAAALREVPYAPVGLLELGVRKDDIPRELDGFGFLAVPSEAPPLLGCIWASAVFPDRAPDGRALLSVFVGGVRTPDDADPDALAARAEAALPGMLGGSFEPEWRAFRWIPRAIPQLNLGHAERISRVRAAVDGVAGLELAGGFLDGVSVHDCVRSGQSAADRLAESSGVGNDS